MELTDRSLVLAPEHANRIVPGGNGVFRKTLVTGGEVTGTWAREGTGRGPPSYLNSFDGDRPLGAAAKAAFAKAARPYLAFLEA